MGDSKLIIDSFINKSRPKKLQLAPLFDGIDRMLGLFQHVSLQHIYREKNQDTNLLSKRGLTLGEVISNRWEYKDDEMTEITQAVL